VVCKLLWWRRPGDVTAVALLVALPTLVFGVPALLGHAVLPGDDLTQNYPLRVLVGNEIRSGHLPLFDPYTWSGSALLAGWNAGAAYPLTLLFAVLPGLAAWSAGLIITWAVAGVGMFCYLRALRLACLASFLGALSFALAGAMAAQVTHFGLVAGMSWVPLALLAVLRLSRGTGSPSGRLPGKAGRLLAGKAGRLLPGKAGLSPGMAGRLRWTGLLGLAIGLVILAGEPRAIVDAFVIISGYAVWEIIRVWRYSGNIRRAASPAISVACGFLLGLGLGAVQWLPGLAAISTSQRGTGSLALFSSGSLPDRWLLLTLVPDVLGGSGSLGQPAFFATYNLTEVTSYVGLLPLVAAFALLARLRIGRRLPEWLIWHLMAAVGVVLALGGNTPLGVVLYHLPLFGSQRLQSRNILMLDLALAVLLAYWLDRPFPARARRLRVHPAERVVRTVGTVRAWRAVRGWRVSAETLLGVLPPLAVLAIVALSLTWGAGLLHWLGTGAAQSADVIGRLRPWLVPYAVLAVAAIALVVCGRRLAPRWRAWILAGFVVTDIVVFTVLGVVDVGAPGVTGASAAGAARPAASHGVSQDGNSRDGVSQSGGSPQGASRLTAADSSLAQIPTAAARPVSALSFPGRFAIYDPGLLDSADLSVLGPPDLNDMTADGMPSVQGYSSIVEGTYASVTGSHEATGEGQNVLSPAAVGNGTLDQLDTSVLLTLPAYLTTSGRPADSSSGSSSSGGSGGSSGAGQRDITSNERTTWYLGESVDVSRVVVPDTDARADAAAGTEIGLVAPDGSTHWFRARAVSSSLEISLPEPMTATTVVGQASGAPCSLGAPSIISADGGVLVADGELQNDLVPPRWGLAGFDGPFAVFSDRFAVGPLTVQALPGESSAGASVSYVAGAPGDPTIATVSSAHGVRLVRSVAAIPGWSATWQPVNGRATQLPVQADGLVQAVDVPPGQGTVTWRYSSPRFAGGLALTIMAALLVIALAVAGARVSRRPAIRRLELRQLIPEVLERPEEGVRLDWLAAHAADRLHRIVADVEQVGPLPVDGADRPHRGLWRVETNN
jgi:hypothetical protein